MCLRNNRFILLAFGAVTLTSGIFPGVSFAQITQTNQDLLANLQQMGHSIKSYTRENSTIILVPVTKNNRKSIKATLKPLIKQTQNAFLFNMATSSFLSRLHAQITNFSTGIFHIPFLFSFTHDAIKAIAIKKHVYAESVSLPQELHSRSKISSSSEKTTQITEVIFNPDLGSISFFSVLGMGIFLFDYVFLSEYYELNRSFKDLKGETEGSPRTAVVLVLCKDLDFIRERLALEGYK